MPVWLIFCNSLLRDDSRQMGQGQFYYGPFWPPPFVHAVQSKLVMQSTWEKQKSVIYNCTLLWMHTNGTQLELTIKFTDDAQHVAAVFLWQLLSFFAYCSWPGVIYRQVSWKLPSYSKWSPPFPSEHLIPAKMLSQRKQVYLRVRAPHDHLQSRRHSMIIRYC